MLDLIVGFWYKFFIMICRKLVFYCFMACLPVITWASEVPNLTITENTNPKIAELYQQLQDAQNKIDEIKSEHLDKLSENYQAVHENEQSLENRTLTAATTAATGIGGMELARGLSEQKADKDAEQNMTAYLETFRCEYGDGKSVKGGTTEIELPGGNNSEMMRLRTEYFALAADLKERKEALGMKPGIESEAILDKAELGLYDDESVGITGGAYASLYRAKMGNETDQSKIDEEKEKSSNRVKGGAIAAGAGVVGGIVGNAIINKDAPKNQSKEINREYDKKLAEATKEQENLTNQLNQAIAENAAEVEKYNDQLQQHQNQIAAINQSPKECQELFVDYMSAVSNLSPIENETDTVPNAEFPDLTEQQNLLEQCTSCDKKDGVFNSETNQCSCPPEKPIEKDGQCVETQVIESVAENETVIGLDPDVEQEHVAGIKPEKEETTEEQTPETEEQTPETEKISEEETTEEEFPEGEYCPATGNRLKSINDKTKIGDMCSSTNIAVGEVVWAKTKQPNTICTCRAYRCNPGFHSEKGACEKDVVEQPECPRQDYKNVSQDELKDGPLAFCERKKTGDCKITSVSSIKGTVICNLENLENGACPVAVYPETEENNTLEKCKSFCETKARENTCFYNGAIIQHSNKRCICNPEQEDFAESNMYKEVCGKDKGKTGKKEHCIKDFFNWTQTQLRQAVALAKDYADIKDHRTINCVEKYRTSGNDDYIKCGTPDGNDLYEFKFDDISESIDATRRGSERSALCRLVGGKIASANNSYSAYSAAKGGTRCAGINKSNCYILLKMAERYGHSVEYDEKKDLCLFTQDGNKNTLTSEEFEDNLAKIDDLDNYYLYHEIQIRGSANLIRSLKTYVKSKISNMKSFRCDDGYKTIKKADGILRKIVGDTDDILRCYVDEKPIDFVFDDLSEAWRTTREAGESGIACKTKGGSFARDKCHGLDEKTCTQIDQDLKRRNPKSSGTRFVDGECELIDGREQKALEDNIQVTMGAVALLDCAVGTHIGCVLAVVEGVSLGVEMGTGEAMQQRANEFLKEATKCQSRQCAIQTLKTLGARVISIQDALSSPSTANSVDEQLARLVGYLEPEDLQNEVSAEDWAEIVRQLGGDPEDKAGKALKIANKIGFIGQFVSVGASALHLTGKAVAKLGAKAATKGSKTGTAMVKVGNKVAKATDTAGDAARGAKGANKADDAASTSGGPRTNGPDNGPKKGGPDAGKTGGADGTGSNTGKTGNADGAGTGAKADGSGNSSKTGDADTGNNSGKGAAGAGAQGAKSGKQGSNSIHSDITNYRNATNKKSAKHALLIKYHPDKVAGYRSEELTGLAEEITRWIDNIDNLSDSELRELSKMMDEFDRSVEAAESAKRAAASAEEASRASQKAENSSQGPKKSTSTDSKSSQSGTKSKETGAKTGTGSANAVNPTAQKLKNLGFTENNGVFISKRTLWSGEIESQLDSMADWKWTYLNAEGSSQGERIYIAMSKEAAAKQGLQWSDEFQDFVRAFNPQSSTNINRAKQLISSGKPITDINGVPVYVRYFGKKSGRPIIMVEINGKKLPFYASSGSAGKTKVATGKWEFFGGIGPDGWFNKGNSIEEIAEHYYSPELRKIAQALDSQVGDVRNVEYVMMSQGRAALNGTGKVGGINGVTELSEDLINSGIEDLGFLPNMLGTGVAKKNIEGIKNWLRNQRASTSSGGAKSTGTGTSGAKGTTSKSGASSSTSGGSTNKNTSGTKSTAGAKGATSGGANSIDALKTRASSNFDNYLQSCLTGKDCVGLPIGRLTKEEWQQLNQYAKSRGAELFETKMFNKKTGTYDDVMQFRRLDNSANTAAGYADDMAGAARGATGGTRDLYVKNSASEILGHKVNGNDAAREVNQLYNKIRFGSYSINETDISNAINAMKNPTSPGVVYNAPTNDYPWYMNGYKSGFSKRAKYHISLNVDVDENLINDLNQIVSKDKGQHILYYKAPSYWDDWKIRHDPITIYISETTPEIEREIARVAKPHMRSSEAGLLGRKIDDGVAIAYETSDLADNIVSDIINQVARKDVRVAEALRAQGRYSTGFTEALRIWASDFLGYIIAPVIP